MRLGALAALAVCVALAACGDALSDGTADRGGATPEPTTTSAPSPGAEPPSAGEPAPPAGTSSAAPAPAPSAPDVHTIPWKTGATIGNGVAMKDTKNPLGENVFVGYAGYEITLASAEAWVSALYDAALASRGVRWLYAVQGPADPGYDAQEIGNSHVAQALVSGEVTSATKFVLVAGHSSGSFVAEELLEQLATGADPSGVTASKVVFFDLDGGMKYASDAAIARLRKAYFVGAHDGTTLSPNHADMASLGAAHAAKGGFLDYDASGSGCDAGANWCVHSSLVITKPHNPATGDPAHDYADFVGRPVDHWWLDAKATEAGL